MSLPPLSSAETAPSLPIGSISDANLSHLDVDDLLAELLERVIALLEVDTAAILLVDEASQQLIARAARGIEEEVRQGVRIAIGSGFAGRIAAERRPVVLDRVDETTVQNPILWQKGIQAMLGVPLQDGSHLLGVLHVGSLTPRRFSKQETSLLELVADRIAAAIRERELEVERAAARVLQRSLLPSALPACPGMQFATRYVPAEEGGVGGDWYDAFVMPSGDLWIMTGDVAGHGLGPAIVMGRLRSAIRAYALEGYEPATVLALADRKLQFFEPGLMATVLCAMARPPYDTIELASAGHPPPVLAVPDSSATLIDVPVTVPLGVLADARRISTTVELPLSSVLLTYTDGLIERRGESLDAGLQRLVDAATASHPEIVCRTVMDALVGSSVPRDDIAVLALRRVKSQP
ncbi:MAG TPA: GAF domain-containing SpoIIE family protein phosphatase [Acidimicrobiales bacterium]